jgi:hypothetical protein
MAVIIIMPKARGIAALSSARLPVLVSRLSMGSQKCTDAADASTCKGAFREIWLRPWQMGYNFERLMPRPEVTMGRSGIPSGPHLAVSAHLIFERGQLLRTDRTASVELARRNTDLAAESELGAVGELG